MSGITYRVTPLPDVWPAGARTAPNERTRPQFKTTWTRALDLLDREVFYLDGSNIEIAIDVAPKMLRADGQLRADARTCTPAVVVSFDTPTGRLVFAADQYGFWQENVDAIARSLEKMRAVDRYGVLRGRHYTGFKQIASTSSAAMTAQAAAEFISRLSGSPAGHIVADRTAATAAIRSAQRRGHPDTGGSAEEFSRVQVAKTVLDAHHGGAA